MDDSMPVAMMLESAYMVFSLPNGSERIVKVDVQPRLVYPLDTVRLSYVIPDVSPSRNVRHGTRWDSKFRWISFLKTTGSMTKQAFLALVRKLWARTSRWFDKPVK